MLRNITLSLIVTVVLASGVFAQQGNDTQPNVAVADQPQEPQEPEKQELTEEERKQALKEQKEKEIAAKKKFAEFKRFEKEEKKKLALQKRQEKEKEKKAKEKEKKAKKNRKSIETYVGLIEGADFAGITLSEEQKTALKTAVTDQVETLNVLTDLMLSFVPPAKRRAFQSAYLKARKNGNSSKASVKIASHTTQLSIPESQLVSASNGSRNSILQIITQMVSVSMTPEQQQKLFDAQRQDLEAN